MARGSPRQIGLALRRRATSLEAAVRAAEKESAAEGVRIARELSQGPLSLRSLARMGHPYRQGGTPPIDPAIIHRHSGRFLAGWKSRPPRKTSHGLVTRILNDSPVARFLFQGTRRMIPRPILRRIGARLSRFRRRALTAALKRSHS